MEKNVSKDMMKKMFVEFASGTYTIFKSMQVIFVQIFTGWSIFPVQILQYYQRKKSVCVRTSIPSAKMDDPLGDMCCYTRHLS